MKIYVVGSSKNKFMPLDDIREKFFIDKQHKGDNIDYLNPWYCELTGLYYLWKHVDDDIVGLEHYRRYFVNDRRKLGLLSKEQITKILITHDIIVDNMHYRNKTFSIWDTRISPKREFDFRTALIVVKEFYPDIYPFVKNYLKERNVVEGNMFICRKELIDEYCSFIFDVLDIYRKGIEHFNVELKPRICGYIAEYFFGGWLVYKNLRKYENKRLYIDKKTGKKSIYLEKEAD